MQDFFDCEEDNQNGPPFKDCGLIIHSLVQKETQLNQLLNDPNCMETVTITFDVLVDRSNDPNDGFILEAEQESGTADEVLQNEFVNHNEALNHPNAISKF